MDRNAFIVALVPALFLFACERAVVSDDEAPIAPPPDVSKPVTTPRVVEDIARPTLPTITPGAERTEKGARNVLLSFARALELKEFDQAWSLLSPTDRRKWSKLQFARNFGDLDTITVAVPDGETDGAAGSIYYRAPITISATDRDGQPIRYEGEAVVKRVNDVEGATEAQLRWHFDTLTLDWTH